MKLVPDVFQSSADPGYQVVSPYNREEPSELFPEHDAVGIKSCLLLSENLYIFSESQQKTLPDCWIHDRFAGSPDRFFSENQIQHYRFLS